MRRATRLIIVLATTASLFGATALAWAAVGGFNGPLFGLSSSPNGGQLVADASTGIIKIRKGEIKKTIPLPGATDVSTLGKGSMWATTGAGESPNEDTGQAVYRIRNGEPKLVANLFEAEAMLNPDGEYLLDSNPFDVHSLGRRSALVVDAGANALLKVKKNGAVKVMALFRDEPVSTANLQDLLGCPTPSIPDLGFIGGVEALSAQPVPTSIAIGPDGYIYVGELKGFPAPAGESSIWRVAPGARYVDCGYSAECFEVFQGGFTSIIDLAFGPDGKLYVAEMDEDSWAAVEIFGGGSGGTINACDVDTGDCTVVASGIPILTAINFNNHGKLFATRNALIPGAAEVFKVG
jgi:hypothetical protein